MRSGDVSEMHVVPRWQRFDVKELHAQAQEAQERAREAQERAREAQERAREAQEAQVRVTRAILFANCALGWVELLVPRRIADEEIGDALEVIRRLVEQRRPAWCVYVKVMTTVGWALFNAVRSSGRRVAERSPLGRRARGR
jgi:hypothetical protein